MGLISFKIILRTSWVLVVLAILDYVYQRWEHEKGLKMSRQEIKDEFRQTEGDPADKGEDKADSEGNGQEKNDGQGAEGRCCDHKP